MDLETVRLIEKFNSLCLSISVITRLMKEDPTKKVNLDNLHEMTQEHQELGVAWLTKHATYRIDEKDERGHYFPKELPGFRND